MTLRQYIKKVGAPEVAQKLGVSKQVLNLWHRRINCPRPEHLALIVKATGGKVTYKEIIEDFLKHRPR